MRTRNVLVAFLPAVADVCLIAAQQATVFLERLMRQLHPRSLYLFLRLAQPMLLLTFASMFIGAPIALAQVVNPGIPSSSSDHLWSDLPTDFNAGMQPNFIETTVETNTAVLQQLAFERFKQMVSKATTESEIEITLPSPTWTGLKYIPFRVHESRLIAPEFAGSISLKTYSGVGKSNANISTRFTVSRGGVRGIVLIDG